MQESPPDFSRPDGMTRQDVLDLVKRYAPRVRISRRENHFPSSPDTFQQQCRFRWSRRFWADRGWSKRTSDWEKGDSGDSHFQDIGWPRIKAVQHKRLSDGHPEDLEFKNDRPRDSNNRHNGTNGLFLQRGEQFTMDRSGTEPLHGRLDAPVFVDFAYRDGSPVFLVLIWFFFELNWTNVFGVKEMHTHEGDWEHVTLVFDVASPGRPHAMYAAAHNDGGVRMFDFLTFEPDAGDHPTVFCDPEGHPTRFSADHPGEYDLAVWDTWQSDVHLVSEQEWRDFGGAWGEVGNTKHTTGPLGPLYKRHRDLLRVKVDAATGRLVMVEAK